MHKESKKKKKGIVVFRCLRKVPKITMQVLKISVDKCRKRVHKYQLPDQCGWYYELKIAPQQAAHIQFLFVDTEEKQYAATMSHFLQKHCVQDRLPKLVT